VLSAELSLNRTSEASNQARDSFPFTDQVLHRWFIQISDVETEVEVGSDFSARGVCNGKKLVKLAGTIPFKTLMSSNRVIAVMNAS
jgi:hypothetical protein